MDKDVDLAALIRQRFGSIHNFCRVHTELKRSTVYMVLAGRYPGRTGPQLAKIHVALGSVKERALPPALIVPPVETLAEALQNIRCKHCRTLDKRRCIECRTQTMLEAKELQAYLSHFTLEMR